MVADARGLATARRPDPHHATEAELPRLAVEDLGPIKIAAGGSAAASPLAGASGLARAGEWLHLIADDGHDICSLRRDDSARAANPTAFRPGQPHADTALRKASKPDIEALLAVEGRGPLQLVGLGSGSTEHRRSGFVVELDPQGAIAGAPRTVQLGELYDAITAACGTELNVEGAVQAAREVLLLVRSSIGDNRLARLDGARFLDGLAAGSMGRGALRSVDRVDLGTLDGIPLGFTDALRHDGRTWFSAAAEDTQNAYDDGEVVGSVLGLLDDDGHVVGRWRVDLPGAKVEGIDAVDTGRAATLWMVTDADARNVPSRLLAARLPTLPRRRAVP